MASYEENSNDESCDDLSISASSYERLSIMSFAEYKYTISLKEAGRYQILFGLDGLEVRSTAVVTERSELPYKRNGSRGYSKQDKERRFYCQSEGCGKSFRKKWNLKAHQRLHSGRKPFKCGRGCGESFMWQSSRTAHEKRRCRLIPLSERTPRKSRSRVYYTEETNSERASSEVSEEQIAETEEERIVMELERILSS